LKLALGFLLVSLVPLGIVSLFSVRTADRLVESIVTSQLENMAAEKQQLLQRWIAERRADLEVVAASEIVAGMKPGPMAGYLRLVRDRYEVYRRFVVVGPGGHAVYDSAAAAGTARSASQDWRQQPCYTAALAGQRYMSPVHLDADAHESVFELATPILGPDGKPQGVVCATVSTAGILRHVLRVSLGETGECYLVDKAGTFLAHQDPNRILRDNIAGSGSFANIFQEEEPRPVYMDYRGIAVLGASRPIPDTEWYVVVEQDEKEAFAPAYRLRWSILIAIAVTAAGAVGISLALAYTIASPIRNLSEAAHALARGEFENPLISVAPPQHGEIGMLHAAFVDMAGKIHDRQASLETRMGRTQAVLEETDDRLQKTIQAAARSAHLASLGRLASGVAHEIRTPLASLKLYLQSVHDEITISPEFTEDFEIAMRQVERIEGTINHFLNFARPAEPVMTNVDFRRLVDEALMVARPRAIHQDVAVETSIAPDLPPVRGDMRQLGEALVNLTVNALEEMTKGGRLRICIEPDNEPAGAGSGGVFAPTDPELGENVAREDAPRPLPATTRPSWVRIDITDTGPGIQEADLDKLFEPFFTTKASGSGLGLSIVRGTLQRHGGTIRVRTSPGEGTTFSLFLPSAESQMVA
jgi:signal transduction histidine kinase